MRVHDAVPSSQTKSQRALQKFGDSKSATLLVLALYLLFLVSTNRVFTLLDDESLDIGIGRLPLVADLQIGGHAEHPPLSDIALHAWLVATHFSFVMLRVFANIFFVAAIWLIAKAAEKVGGRRAYWITLCIGYAWPFAFQYGRIVGYYLMFMALDSLLTWIYLTILEDAGSSLRWCAFAGAGIAAMWTNQIAAAMLVLLAADLFLFHRNIVREKMRLVLATAVALIVGSSPLLKFVFESGQNSRAAVDAPQAAAPSLIATIGYPAFSMFGSVAIAPWFWPLSIPVFVCAVALCAAVGFSEGRKWLVYFLMIMAGLVLSGHANVKRTLFLMSWFFLAVGIAASGKRVVASRVAQGAVAGLLLLGWAGILSGKHYATTNLVEPWAETAHTVAADLKQGKPTVISDNPNFFLYLDYELGLQGDVLTSAEIEAKGQAQQSPAYAEEAGYNVFLARDRLADADRLQGNIILVKGSGEAQDIEAMDALNAALANRCTLLRELRTAPDPALEMKKRFAATTPALAYRIDVHWYHCAGQGA